MFCEARRTSPSILYVPRLQQWWETAGPSLRASFLSLLGSIPSFSPVLLLATCSVPHQELDPEIGSLFREEYGEVYTVSVSGRQERTDFFQDLILHQAAEAPPSTKPTASSCWTEVHSEFTRGRPAPQPRKKKRHKRTRKSKWSTGIIKKTKKKKLPFPASSSSSSMSNSESGAEENEPVGIMASESSDGEQNHRTATINGFHHDLEIQDGVLMNGYQHPEPLDLQPADRVLRDRTSKTTVNGPCWGPVEKRNGGEARANKAALEQTLWFDRSLSVEILNKETPLLLVNRSELKYLLSRAMDKTEGAEVESLEKLYALLAQCIYRHRTNPDKMELIQEMKKEIDGFS